MLLKIEQVENLIITTMSLMYRNVPKGNVHTVIATKCEIANCGIYRNIMIKSIYLAIIIIIIIIIVMIMMIIIIIIIIIIISNVIIIIQFWLVRIFLSLYFCI